MVRFVLIRFVTILSEKRSLWSCLELCCGDGCVRELQHCAHGGQLSQELGGAVPTLVGCGQGRAPVRPDVVAMNACANCANYAHSGQLAEGLGGAVPALVNCGQ